MKYIYFLLASLFIFSCNNPNEKPNYDFKTTFENSNGTQTGTYHEVIDYWKALADSFAEIDIQEVGMTDSGFPLHLVTLNPDEKLDFDQLRNNHRIILINNGIHPGESDGIDATMMLFRASIG